jgi:uncharacterized protein
MEGSLVSTFDELYGPLLRNISKLNVNAYISLLKMDICPSANRNSFVLGSDGTIYKCTMLFNEDFNKLGRLTLEGRMEIDQYKYAKWVSLAPECSEKCRSCNLWSLCHNRSCPAKGFSKDKAKREGCGYEKKSLDYVLKFLDISGNRHIKTYETGGIQ